MRIKSKPLLYCSFDKQDETPLKLRDAKVTAKPPKKKSKNKKSKELRKIKNKQNKIEARNVLKLIDSLGR